MRWRPGERRNGDAEREQEFAQAYHMRLAHVRRIDQPLVLISQVNRSGGTLLSQLFSGHPQCHVHPGELLIGFPKKEFWPTLDLGADPAQWFALLSEKHTPEYARDGFIKVPPRLRDRYDRAAITHPFAFVPTLQRDIFDATLAETGAATQRAILDAYMTSYFNAWLDYQNLHARDARLVVGFVPRLVGVADSVDRFFRDYPEGRLISIVRDPCSWFVSWQRKKPEERPHPESGMPRWKASAEGMLRNRERYGERVRLLRFETLLSETEPTMRGLAEWLGLDFDPILLRPTFQTIDIGANSSDRVEEMAGVLASPLARSSQLPETHTHYIREQTLALYERVLAVTDA